MCLLRTSTSNTTNRATITKYILTNNKNSTSRIDNKNNSQPKKKEFYLVDLVC
jgi:hypothetical protein